jgi:hypothetical protein
VETLEVTHDDSVNNCNNYELISVYIDNVDCLRNVLYVL